MSKHFDIIIIGSGLSGLYSAYTIKKNDPTKSFVVLEKYKKQWIGGRTNNETFYGTEIVTGAGIGRKKKDKLLIHLLNEMDIHPSEFKFSPKYSNLLDKSDITSTINYLRSKYNTSAISNTNNCNSKNNKITFQQFAKTALGNESYKKLLETIGYTDYEKEDVSDVLYYYGIEDNTCCWTALHVPWKQLVLNLCNKIGMNNIKPSNDVTRITKIQENPCVFLLDTEKGAKYTCNKVIIATTITGIRKFLPKYNIYNQIEGQPFLRLYGKFSKKSIPIMEKYVLDYTIVPGPLQKIIPMNADKGVYMIAYSDNNNAKFLKSHLDNTNENREFYCRLIEKSLGIVHRSLELIAITDFYWPIGTHYYKPLDTCLYKSREEFINIAQHPEDGILVVGEVVSRDQGWTNGALSSVTEVLTKKWIKTIC